MAKADVINGQYTLKSYIPPKKRRPCEYSFNRYIGQMVKDHRGVHRIAEIEDFYTIYDDNTCGTPHDIIPLDPEERREALEVEREYFENKSRNRDLSQRLVKGGE